RRRHQGPRDEDALTLALRKHAEWAAPQMRRRERLERRKRAGLLDAREGSILADRGFQAGKHDRSGIVCVGEARLEGGGDAADLLAQLAQIGAAESGAQHFHGTLAGPFVSAQDAGERGLSRAIGPEDRPVLAGLDRPLHAAEYLHSVPSEGPDLDAGHWKRTVHARERTT